MKVCKIYDGEYPWDVRVWKIVTSMAQCGHEVHLICRNLSGRPYDEVMDDIHIHRLPNLKNRGLNYLLNFPLFLNPVWIKRISDVVKDHHVDLVIVRDLPLALVAGLIGKHYNVPVILDMAENYPAMLHDIWRFEKFRLQNVFVRNPLLAKMIEAIATRLVDHIFVVIEEARENLIKVGIRSEKISIIKNTPKLSSIHSPKDWQVPQDQDGRLSIVFVGGLEPMRGLEKVFEMLSEAVQMVPSLHFTIVGSGKWEEDLKKKTQVLGIDRHVTFTGRQDYERALFQVSKSDIGIIPHCITAHTNSTIPNKLFEYMLQGKPVMASNMIPVARIIQESNCGIVYRNKSEFLDGIVKLQDLETRRKLGENGRKAVLTRYNWGQDLKNLIRAVSVITEKSKSISFSGVH